MTEADWLRFGIQAAAALFAAIAAIAAARAAGHTRRTVDLQVTTRRLEKLQHIHDLLVTLAYHRTSKDPPAQRLRTELRAAILAVELHLPRCETVGDITRDPDAAAIQQALIEVEKAMAAERRILTKQAGSRQEG